MMVPFIKFIEVLIAGHLNPMQVYNRLQDLGLAFPEEGVRTVYEQMSKLYPDHFENSGEPVDVAWLEELDISRMYGYEFQVSVPSVEGVKGAFNIVNDPMVYRLITSLALAKANEEEIESIVNGNFNLDYSAADIHQFLHYFFNIEDWTFVQKKNYQSSIEDTSLKKYYKLALSGDKDYLVYKLGATPDISFDEMLRDMASASYYNFKEKAKHDPDTAQKWGALAVKLVDRIDKIEKETGDKEDLFETITFQLRVSKDPKGEQPVEIRHISEIDKEEK